MTISYDRARREAIFHGPGGFHQALMDEQTARFIALALEIPFHVIQI